MAQKPARTTKPKKGRKPSTDFRPKIIADSKVIQSGRNEALLVVVLAFQVLVSITVVGNAHLLSIVLDFTACLHGDEPQQRRFREIRRIAEVGSRFFPCLYRIGELLEWPALDPWEGL